MRIGKSAKTIFELQAPATLNQAAPVQNTWYNILTATGNVRVYQVAVNVEDTDETLECQFIVDGQTLPATALPATHSTVYYVTIALNAINRLVAVVIVDTTNFAKFHRAYEIEGKSVQIQVRKTTATGAGNLTGVALYGVAKRA